MQAGVYVPTLKFEKEICCQVCVWLSEFVCVQRVYMHLCENVCVCYTPGLVQR